MVIEIGSEKRKQLVKDDQAYHLPEFTPTKAEINKANIDPDVVEPKRKGRRCGCGYISGLLIFILLGSSLYLGVEVARMKKMRASYERPLFHGIDSLFDEDEDYVTMNNTNTSFSDFNKIPKRTWTKIAKGIKKCIIPKDMVPTEENVVGVTEPKKRIGGKENGMEMDFKNKYEVDCECLKNMLMENKSTARQFFLKSKRLNKSKPQHSTRRTGGPGSDDTDGDDFVQPFRLKRPNLTAISSFPNDNNRRGRPVRPGSDGPGDVELNQLTKPYRLYRPYRHQRPHRPHRPHRPQRPHRPDQPDRPYQPKRQNLTTFSSFPNDNNRHGRPERTGSDGPGDKKSDRPIQPQRSQRPHQTYWPYRPYRPKQPNLTGNNHRGQPGRPGSDGSHVDEELDRPHQANRPDLTNLPSFLIDNFLSKLPESHVPHGLKSPPS